METFNNKKRKKRKTRKCLNELRQKIHQPSGVCELPHKNTDVHIHKNTHLKSCNYITSNRLTLYNKTVRSKTVTRLQLPKIGSKNILKLKKKQTTDFGINLIPDQTVLEKENEINTENGSGKEIMSPTISKTRHETPKSVLLFTPKNQDDEANNTKLNSSLDLVLSSSSSSISNTDRESNFYYKFINEIDQYIENNFSQFLTCDTVEKTRTYLINTYFANGYRKTENYSTSYVSRDAVLSNTPLPPEGIIQNPKDYIGYSWNQDLKSDISKVLVSSPTESTSSDPIYIPSTSPITNIVYDSPEYSYYPHKLN